MLQDCHQIRSYYIIIFFRENSTFLPDFIINFSVHKKFTRFHGLVDNLKKLIDDNEDPK